MTKPDNQKMERGSNRKGRKNRISTVCVLIRPYPLDPPFPRSIALVFSRVRFCPQGLHYRGKPEAAPLQKTDHPPLVPIARRRKGKTGVAALCRRSDLGYFIAHRQERRKGFNHYIRSETSAAHLQTETRPEKTAGGKRRFRKPSGITPVIQPSLTLEAENRSFALLSGKFPRRQLSHYRGNGIIPAGQQPQHILVGPVSR